MSAEEYKRQEGARTRAATAGTIQDAENVQIGPTPMRNGCFCLARALKKPQGGAKQRGSCPGSP